MRKLFAAISILSVLAFFPAGHAYAAGPVADTATTGSANGQSSVTVNHSTCTGTNAQVVISLSTIGSALLPTGITVNGSAAIDRSFLSDAGNGLSASVWTFTATSTGNQEVVLSWSSTNNWATFGVFCVSGLIASPIGATNTAESSVNGTSISTNITTLGTNSMIVDAVHWFNNNTTSNWAAGGGASIEWALQAPTQATWGRGSVNAVAGASSHAVSWTWTGSDKVAQAVLELEGPGTTASSFGTLTFFGWF